MRTSARFDAKDFRFFEIYSVSARTRGGEGVELVRTFFRWKYRKHVDPTLLRFFIDHWIFAWLPKNFRETIRFGVEKNDADEPLDEKAVDSTKGVGRKFSRGVTEKKTEKMVKEAKK